MFFAFNGTGASKRCPYVFWVTQKLSIECSQTYPVIILYLTGGLRLIGASKIKPREGVWNRHMGIPTLLSLVVTGFVTRNQDMP